MPTLSVLPITLIFWILFLDVSGAQPLLSPCQAPAVHARSDTLHVEGPFDQNPENTRLTLDGQTFRPVRETAETAAFLLEGAGTGLTEYELLEPGYGCAGTLRIIAIESSINRSRFRRGQKGKISLRVHGLEGIREAVTLRIRNESPGRLSLTGGEVQEWKIRPGDKPAQIIPVRGVRPGPFTVTVELKQPATEETTRDGGGQDQESEADGEEKTSCGSVYGKVDNQLGRVLRQVVVFIAGACDLCPPRPAIDTLKITNDCERYDPSWAVVPVGAIIAVENTAKFECDIAPHQSTKFPDGSGFDEVFGPGETKQFEAKSYWENDNGLPQDYGLSDRFHQRIDMSFFIAPNQCYSVADEEGRYAIGELPPGSYTLKVYTYPQRSATPVATVQIEAGKRIRKDFVLEKK